MNWLGQGGNMNSRVFDIHRKLGEGAEKIREAERIARECGDGTGADEIGEEAERTEQIKKRFDPRQM